MVNPKYISEPPGDLDKAWNIIITEYSKGNFNIPLVIKILHFYQTYAKTFGLFSCYNFICTRKYIFRPINVSGILIRFVNLDIVFTSIFYYSHKKQSIGTNEIQICIIKSNIKILNTKCE